MGDAIMALEGNVPLITHDHSNSGSRPTSLLNQANTHQNADTDLALNSLHHTLGSSANQAAPGNHLHYTPYYCRAAFGPGDTYTNNGDIVTGAGWIATDDSSNLWSTAGGNPLFTCPATGRWKVFFRAVIAGTGANGVGIGVKCLKNFPPGAPFNNAYVVAGDSRQAFGFAQGPFISEVLTLNATDTLRFSIFTSAPLTVYANVDFIGDSYMSFVYLGPSTWNY
jgi:hypothetical protein